MDIYHIYLYLFIFVNIIIVQGTEFSFFIQPQVYSLNYFGGNFDS